MGISDGINRFKRRHGVQDRVKRDMSLSFLTKSPSKVNVVLQKNEWEIDALVVSTYKEGPNEMLMFTFNNTTDESLPLNMQRNVYLGDYITYKHKTYLVFDEFDHPDYADYKKHKIIECNVHYGYNNKKFGGFYMGSRRKLETLNEGSLAQAISLAQDGNSPLLIVAKQSDLKPRTRIMINGEAWMIDNIDRNTIPDILFLSIHLDTVTMNDNVQDSIASSPSQPVIDIELLRAGDTITVETNFSYIRFDTDVQILNQEENEIQFVVPYNVNTLTMTTKDEEGDLVSIIYEVA
jgi:hypothetical protein